MTAEVKLVSEMVREYIDELNQRPGVMDPEERAALVDAYQKRKTEEALAPFRSMMAQQEAERAEAKRIADAEREARDRAQREAQMAALKRDLQANWLRAGGEPEDFEKQWPRLRNEHLSTQTLSTKDAARATYARRIHDSF